MFHPRPAEWFDLMVPQDALGRVLETLAGAGAVELETHEAALSVHGTLASLQDGLETFTERERRYHAYWPDADRTAPFPDRPPRFVLADALAVLDAWTDDARAAIETLQRAQAFEVDLLHVLELLGAAGDAFPMRLLDARQGQMIDAAVYLLAEPAKTDRAPWAAKSDLFTQLFSARNGDYLVVVGEQEPRARLEVELTAAKARRIQIPTALPAATTAADLPDTLNALVEEQRTMQAEARTTIEDANERHGVAHVLADLERLGWLAEHAGPTARTRNFARITGWTALPLDGLNAALARADVPYVLSGGAAPEGKEPPMILNNPPWARPFEVFVRLLGQPGRNEADPSPIIAVMAPLMFGFMFGDVGQGAVLLLAGLYLRKRWPVAAILVPGGLFAMVFGFAFGSVFASEEVIGALWLHPLATPIPLLAVALGFGTVVLLTGLALNATGAHWRGAGAQWWQSSAGLVLAYLGVLASFADIRALGLTALGAVWFVAGTALAARDHRGQAAGIALAETVETLFQLVINTLSFVRVGAFAIAHAGLSSAIVVLAEITGGGIGFWTVMIVGNVFIIALEGLVAGIQTTRLLLFEFFIRFLKAEGRALKSLPLPASWGPQFQGRVLEKTS